MKFTRTIQIELGARKADAKRTFSAVLSTEAPVRRRDWERGDFLEVLSHKQNAVDLSRAPLPLLESHSLNALPIGIVDNVRLDGGKLRGDVTFGTSQRAQEIAADVEAGIIRNLSIGYSVEKTDEKTDGKQKTITATRWMPYEASAVAIGADAGAGFGRSISMDDDTTGQPNTEQRSEPNNETRAIAVERSRCSEINRLTRALGDEPAFAQSLIDSGATVAAARAQLVDRRADREVIVTERLGAGGYEAIRGRGRVAAGLDDGGEFRGAAVDALLLRAGVALAKPHPAARDVSGSVIEIARTCVSRTGDRLPKGNEEILRRAMSTGDFPLILGDVMHKAIRTGYETEPASHRSWVRTQPVPDFRDQHRVILGSAPGLAPVNEGGEYTNGSLNEDATSYRVGKFGRIVTLTWETLVNDTLGAFVRIQPAMGQAARRLEADTVYALLAENGGLGPTMQDNVVLFHASHANLVAGAAFTATALGAARALLRKQTALGGGHLSLVPRSLIIPAELEQAAEVLVAQATRSVTTVDDATPQWIASLQIVVEPRLAGNAFYLAADGSQIDHCELGLLEENEAGPVITEEQEFRRDVFSWKVRHVIGAKFLDWRGIVKHPIG